MGIHSYWIFDYYFVSNAFHFFFVPMAFPKPNVCTVIYVCLVFL